METKLFLKGTLEELHHICFLDVKIIDMYDQKEHNSSPLIISGLEEAAYDIASYMIESNWDMPNFNNNRVKDFLTTVMNNPLSVVKIYQSILNPYTFILEPVNGYYYFPAILTRALIKQLKIMNIKIEVSKRHRSLLNEDTVELCELVFTGKSSINKLLWEKVAEACKKIRFPKCNPWLSEKEEKEENHDLPLLNEANLRFRGAEWFLPAQQNVTLVGCGGLGSNIAISLCRVMGNKSLYLFDSDTIEPVNLAGQNFGISDIGKEKTATVKEQCENFNPELNVVINDNFGIDSVTNNITITGLDNMVTRKLVFSKWQELLKEGEDNKNKLLIDARLSAEMWQVFCITGDNKKAQEVYEDKWLFSDEEAESEVCSYKQTAFAAQMCASFVTNLYVNFCANLRKDEDDPTRRYLPFFTEYIASQMVLRQENIEN